MRAVEICHPRDHHTRVGDRLLKRCEMNAWIARRVMRKGWQRVAIGLRDILSRDSATRSRQRPRWWQRATLSWPGFEGARGDAFRTGLPRLFKTLGRSGSRKPASGKPCGVDRYRCAHAEAVSAFLKTALKRHRRP
jgi:hypothetical protein